MGSTGRRTSGKPSTSVFDVKDAKRTELSGLETQGIPTPTKQDIQLKVGSREGKDIIFQFRLTKDNEMSIRAYDPNEPSRAKVSVTTKDASLDSVIKSADSTKEEKTNARKIKEMINQTTSGITQSSLKKIANELIMNKNKKG